MKPNRTTTGLLLLVVMAFGGFVLLYVPPKIVTLYDQAQQLGPTLAYLYLALVSLGGLLLMASTAWIIGKLWWHTRRKRERRRQQSKNPSQLSRAEQQREMEENLAAVQDLKGDPSVAQELKRELEPLVQRLDTKREEQLLEIVAFGTISGGKSSLLNTLAGRDVFPTDAKGGTTVRRNQIPWPGMDQVVLVDTPGLGEVDGAQNVRVSAEAAKDADLVLVVVDGPLRQSEFQLLRQLGAMEKRVLICLNKEDWYAEQDKTLLLEQIANQVKDFVRQEDVVAVRARPAERTRVRVLSDGSQTQEPVPVAADIEPLARRMMAIVRRDGRDLLLANLLLQSRGMVEAARSRVRQSLDRRAWEIVDKYTWGASGAAALSPLPVLDLLAGSAISTKMVLDLARVYRQEMDFDTAVQLLGQLGKNLIAILGVTAATPAVVAGVASLLKTVPGAGTIAGGLLQGVVQALVTRWIGAVFIQYFKSEMEQNADALTSLARKEWEKITTVQELRKLLQTARSRLNQTRQDS